MASLIQPSHRGRLHKKLGLKPGARIPLSRLEAAKNAKDPAERKEANFAINFHHARAKGRSTKDHASRMYGAKK